MDTAVLIAAGAAGAATSAALVVIAIRRLTKRRHDYEAARDVVKAIVTSLTRRFEQNELTVKQLIQDLESLRVSRSDERQRERVEQRLIDRLTEHIEAALANDKRLIQTMLKLREKIKEIGDQQAAFRTDLERLKQVERPVPAIMSAPFAVNESVVSRLTATETKVLAILGTEGSKSAPEIGRAIEKSREHTTRLMKLLYEQGYVERESNRIPYRYTLNEKIRELVPKVARGKTAEVTGQRG